MNIGNFKRARAIVEEIDNCIALRRAILDQITNNHLLIHIQGPNNAVGTANQKPFCIKGSYLSTVPPYLDNLIAELNEKLKSL